MMGKLVMTKKRYKLYGILFKKTLSSPEKPFKIDPKIV